MLVPFAFSLCVLFSYYGTDAVQYLSAKRLVDKAREFLTKVGHEAAARDYGWCSSEIGPCAPWFHSFFLLVAL